MKRTFSPIAASKQPLTKRQKLIQKSEIENDNKDNKRNKKKKQYKSRIIGLMDIKSKNQDYCITIKEHNLFLEYYPNFYSKKESKEILNNLEKSIKYDSAQQSSVIIFGKKHKIPRKQTAFGDIGTSYKFSGNNVSAKNWDKLPLLIEIKNKIEQQISSKFNFVLINRYKDGNDKIGAHKDDEKDLKPDSIAGVSFGASRDIIFKYHDIVRKNKNKKHDTDFTKIIKIKLNDGSLIVMRNPTNSYWYHEIPKRKKLKNVRISLTFRNMIKYST